MRRSSGGGAHPAGVGDPTLTCSLPTSDERRIKGAGKRATFTGSERTGSDGGALLSERGGSHPAGEGGGSHPANEVMLYGMIAACMAEDTRRLEGNPVLQSTRQRTSDTGQCGRGMADHTAGEVMRHGMIAAGIAEGD